MTKGAFGPPSLVFVCLSLFAASASAEPEGLVNPSPMPQPDSVLQLSEQDIYLSSEAVTIRLLLRNPTDRPVRETLSLPLPLRDLAAERAQPVHLPQAELDDFLAARLTIDDVPASPQTEIKGLLQGRDITSQMQRQSVPLTANVPLVERALDALLSERREFLERRGMVEGMHPLWAIKTTLTWGLDVPAKGSRRVELRYTPSRFRQVCEIGAECRALLGASDPARCRPKPETAQIERLEKRAKDDKLDQFLAEEVRFTAQPWPTPPTQLRLRADRLGRDNPLHLCGGISGDVTEFKGGLPNGETRFGIVRVIPKAEVVAR